MVPDVEFACDAGEKGSMLDYAVVSEAAPSHIAKIEPVLGAPWRPHIGIVMTIRSAGAPLLTRRLECAVRLPQISMPQASATPGPKSSVTKQTRKEATARAAINRREQYAALFDLPCKPQSSLVQQSA